MMWMKITTYKSHGKVCWNKSPVPQEKGVLLPGIAANKVSGTCNIGGFEMKID